MAQFPTEWYHSSVSRECVHKKKKHPNFTLQFPSHLWCQPLSYFCDETPSFLGDSIIASSSVMPDSFPPLWYHTPLNIQDGRNPITSVGTEPFLPSPTMPDCLHPLWLPPSSMKPDSIFVIWDCLQALWFQTSFFCYGATFPPSFVMAELPPFWYQITSTLCNIKLYLFPKLLERQMLFILIQKVWIKLRIKFS